MLRQRTKKSIFVIANGGSVALEKQDLAKLKNRDTIACNGYYPNGKNMFGLDVTYYFIGDGRRLQREWGEWDVLENIKNTNAIFSFAGEFNMDFESLFKGAPNVTILPAQGKNDDPWNIEKGIYRKFPGRSTSTNVMVQIAFWLGYKKIYLLGHDLQKKYSGYFWQLKRLKFGKPKTDRPEYKVKNQMATWKHFKKRASDIGAEIITCTGKDYSRITRTGLFRYASFESALKESEI